MDEFDLIRAVALRLSGLQRSPPEPILIDIDEYAAEFGCGPSDLARALARLDELGLIEGPPPSQFVWFFRKMSTKGEVFVDEVRSGRRWSEIKAQYRALEAPRN